jgi:hypothetical protein
MRMTFPILGRQSLLLTTDVTMRYAGNNSFSRDCFRLRNSDWRSCGRVRHSCDNFFTLFFGVIEIARATYICNYITGSHAPRCRVGHEHGLHKDEAIQDVREAAIFRASPRLLAFAEPVTDARIKVDYMLISRDAALSRRRLFQRVPCRPVR